MSRTIIHTYKTYNFKDKDPTVDELRTKVQDRAKRLGLKEQAVVKTAALDAGMSKSTPTGWFYGKTRRPQSATLEAFGRALGYKRVWELMK